MAKKAANILNFR